MDLSDHATLIEKPELYYGGQNFDKECLHVYEGKAIVRVPWSHIECVEPSGQATELDPDLGRYSLDLKDIKKLVPTVEMMPKPD